MELPDNNNGGPTPECSDLYLWPWGLEVEAAVLKIGSSPGFISFVCLLARLLDEPVICFEFVRFSVSGEFWKTLDFLGEVTPSRSETFFVNKCDNQCWELLRLLVSHFASEQIETEIHQHWSCSEFWTHFPTDGHIGAVSPHCYNKECFWERVGFTVWVPFYSKLCLFRELSPICCTHFLREIWSSFEIYFDIFRYSSPLCSRDI